MHVYLSSPSLSYLIYNTSTLQHPTDQSEAALPRPNLDLSVASTYFQEMMQRVGKGVVRVGVYECMCRVCICVVVGVYVVYSKYRLV